MANNVVIIIIMHFHQEINELGISTRPGTFILEHVSEIMADAIY